MNLVKRTLEDLVKQTDFKIKTARGRNMNNGDFTLNIKFYDEEKNLCKDICYERIKWAIEGYPYKGTKKELIWSHKMGIKELRKGQELCTEYQNIRDEASVYLMNLKLNGEEIP